VFVARDKLRKKSKLLCVCVCVCVRLLMCVGWGQDAS